MVRIAAIEPQKFIFFGPQATSKQKHEHILRNAQHSELKAETYELLNQETHQINYVLQSLCICVKHPWSNGFSGQGYGTSLLKFLEKEHRRKAQTRSSAT